MRVEGTRYFESIRHSRVVIGGIRHTSSLAGIESPAQASLGPQVQSRKSIELARVRDCRDRPKNAFRLVDAGAVIGLDTRKIAFGEPLSRQVTGSDSALNIRNRRFLEGELFLCNRGRGRSTDLDNHLIGTGQRNEQEGQSQCQSLQRKSHR